MIIFWILLLMYMIYSYCISFGEMQDSKRRYLLLLGTVMLYIIIVFRPYEVPDTSAYAMIFDGIDAHNPFKVSGLKTFIGREYTTGTEYGFAILSQFIKRFITENPRGYFAIIAFFEIILFAKFIKTWCGHDIKKMSWLVYFAIPYFGFMYLCVTIRAGLAIAIGLNAFAIGKKSKKNVLVAGALYLLAFTFHRMAIIFLLIDAIYYFAPKFKKATYWILWGICGGLCIFKPIGFYSVVNSLLNMLALKSPLIASYQGYFNANKTDLGAISFRQLYFWSFGLFFIFLMDNYISKEYKKLLNIYICGLFVMNMAGFISGASRIYDYFMILIPMLMTSLYATSAPKISQRTLWLVELLYGMAGVAIIVRL